MRQRTGNDSRQSCPMVANSFFILGISLARALLSVDAQLFVLLIMGFRKLLSLLASLTTACFYFSQLLSLSD